MKIKSILILCLCYYNLFSQGNYSGLKFLTNADGRINSLAETKAINSVGASALLGNPSAMNQSLKSEIQIGVIKSIQDITSQSLLLKLQSSKEFSFGFSLVNYKISDIEIREVPGEPLGTFSSQYISAGIAGAYTIFTNIDVGLNAKIIYEKIYVEDATGFGIDIGAYYKLSNDIHLGCTFNNIGQMSLLYEERTVLPLSANLGAAYHFELYQFFNKVSCEFTNYIKDKTNHFSFSIESTYNDLISIRLGYITGFESKNFSAGLGIKYSDFVLNYGYVPFSYNLGTHHSLSINYAF
jgi:hypothetical protein